MSMTFADSILTLRNSEDQKLIYLYILDNPYSPYMLVRRQCRFETAERFYTNLRRLAEMGLIFAHPFLMSNEITKKDITKVSGLSLNVIDTSLRTLLWAVSDDYINPYDVPNITESQAAGMLRALAAKEKREIEFWHGIDGDGGFSGWLD